MEEETTISFIIPGGSLKVGKDLVLFVKVLEGDIDFNLSEPTVQETLGIVQRIRACTGEAAGIAILANKYRQLYKEREEYKDAEATVSDAYLRLRDILNAWDTPHAPTLEQVYAHVEYKARELVERVKELEEKCRTH